MADKKNVVDVKFKDLREAVVALNEWKDSPIKIKLIGDTKEVILANFKKVMDKIEDVDGKFPGPKIALNFFNALIDAEEKANAANEKTEVAGAKEKAKAAKPAAKEKAAKPKKEKAAKEPKEPKVTKKSIVIDMVSKKGGATVEDMAVACTDAGLGDLDTNKKTVVLWLKKLGFPVQKNEKTLKWSKAAE